MWVFFFWSEICTYVAVSDLFMTINKDVMFWDENDSIHAMDCIRNTLCQSAKFLPIGSLPGGAVLGVLDEVSVFHEFACLLIKNCIKDVCRKHSGCRTLSSEGRCVELE